MSFYTSPVFFIALSIAVLIAACIGLGTHGNKCALKRYGLIASVVFLILMFSSSWVQLAAFIVFLAVSGFSTKMTLKIFSKDSAENSAKDALKDSNKKHAEDDEKSGKNPSVKDAAKDTLKTSAKNNKQHSVIKYRCLLTLTLAPLAIYKVSAIFDSNILGFIGISYVTFKAVQVLIEIRDGLIKELRFFDWLYFIVFFATITSGPIDRSRRFFEDINDQHSAPKKHSAPKTQEQAVKNQDVAQNQAAPNSEVFAISNQDPAAPNQGPVTQKQATKQDQHRQEYANLLSRGILLILIGAIYQLVIATILHADITFQPFYAQKGVLFNLLSAGKDGWLYGLYLFFDFAGYSMMACGVSYCFGIKTPRNFRAPFASIDIKDFWNRWHITLSFWLRDFVFMRLVTALTKRKIFKTRLNRACVGYIVNMTIMGCWHGLTPEYILYGFYHGVLLAICDVFQKKSKFYKKHKSATWYKLCSWAVTLNLVMIGFAIFSGQLTIFLGGIFA